MQGLRIVVEQLVEHCLVAEVGHSPVFEVGHSLVFAVHDSGSSGVSDEKIGYVLMRSIVAVGGAMSLVLDDHW